MGMFPSPEGPGDNSAGWVEGQSSQAVVTAGRARGVQRDEGLALTGGTEPTPNFQPALIWSALVFQMLHQFRDASSWQGWRKSTVTWTSRRKPSQQTSGRRWSRAGQCRTAPSAPRTSRQGL